MFKNLAVVGLGNFVNGLGGLLFLIASARLLPVSGYGKFALIASIFLLLSKLTELGTTSSFVSLSIKYSKDFGKSLMVIKVVLTILILVLALPILSLFNLSHKDTLIPFFIGILGYVINDYLFAYFQLFEKFFLASCVNALPALFKLTAALVLLNIGSLTLVTSLYLYFGSQVICIVLIPFTRRLKKFPEYNLRTGIFALLSKGVLGGLSQTLNISVPAINSFLLAILTSLPTVAVFSLAEKIASVFNLISYTIFTVMLPTKAKEAKESGRYEIKNSIILSALVLLASAIMIMLTKPTLNFLFGMKYQDSVPILQLMFVSYALTSIFMFMDNYFFIREQTKFLLGINTIRVFSLIVLVLALTQRFGVKGTAYANIITSLLLTATVFGTIISKERKIKNGY